MSDPSGARPAKFRALFLLLGLLMVAFGVIGAFLPIMPSTIFFIVAVWAFGRSSPKLETWLLDHPRFGPPLLRWQKHGAISPASKRLACAGIAFGYLVFFVTVGPDVWLALVVATFMLGCTVFILTRPSGVAG
ncbi:YbaN family protein [Limoniibacter endophyticus]|uniref:DUF454 domain-containing protein n=1 Tax=Limoniibacter endophyticus TaxID=1565040 RepID=A0A8J3GH73_9HYPH|nr:YbaN family protein [Limoniibacter endophyticus]GHC72921.1 hypothetical protein GCM10010136_20970 [Limoniibacter endophyticus]